MTRIALAVAAALIALAVAAQLVLPSLAEHRVESRLTEGGGSAEVSIDALPAERLLFGDGDGIDVQASSLDLDLTSEERVFDHLDGFGRVDVRVDDSRAGPFEVAAFSLTRDGGGPYSLRASASTTPAALASYGAARLDLPGAPLLGLLAGQISEEADRRIPIELDMGLESDAGRIRVVSGGGSIAGLPTGPLAELLTATFAVRL